MGTITKELRLDPFKLMHWMNARKVTPKMVSASTGLSESLISEITSGVIENVDSSAVNSLLIALNVTQEQLVKDENNIPKIIYSSKEEVDETRREVRRDGIHFYNYYTLPSPKGFIAPVILDILCPEGRLPALNKGHLEPAITINLGPGDIFGRWAEETSDLSFSKLDSNYGNDEAWIIGESYVEPCYCLHSYALASKKPARILSYTIKTELESFLQQMNNLSEKDFNEIAENLKSKQVSRYSFSEQMKHHGYCVESLSSASDLEISKISDFLAGSDDALTISEVKKISLLIGFDYRLALSKNFKIDGLGKVHLNSSKAKKTIRNFKSYRVASMANSPMFPDLSGLFIEVTQKEETLDLCENINIHYLASGGEMSFYWVNESGDVEVQKIKNGDSLWISPYTKHGFSGEGSLIKMNNGERCGYLSRVALDNVYNLNETLNRGREDVSDWGYDN